MLGATLSVKFFVTFPQVVSTISKEMFRWVYSNLLVEFEGCPQQRNISTTEWYKKKISNIVSNSGKKNTAFSLVQNDRRARNFSINFTVLQGHIPPNLGSAI
jgi:hypothetical protein